VKIRHRMCTKVQNRFRFRIRAQHLFIVSHVLLFPSQLFHHRFLYSLLLPTGLGLLCSRQSVCHSNWTPGVTLKKNRCCCRFLPTTNAIRVLLRDLAADNIYNHVSFIYLYVCSDPQSYVFHSVVGVPVHQRFVFCSRGRIGRHFFPMKVV
jgi:hypothetical protein